jgi:hypothetical protein
VQILYLHTNERKDIVIELVTREDYKGITKAKYFFNWAKEKQNIVFKLRMSDSEEILGLMSLKHFKEEKRLEIVLLASSKENVGKTKQYDGIVGNLIAYACRESIKLHAADGCVSLLPKTKLKKHYIEKYGMIDAGQQIFLEGAALFKLLKEYAV